MDDDDETYILLLLSDSNLPTGSFIASSGLESYVKHGFAGSNIVSFIQDSLAAHGRSALPFVSDAHRFVSQVSALLKDIGRDPEEVGMSMNRAMKDLSALDELYHTMTLNHVSRRASKAQGVALLGLYSKGFSHPSPVSETSGNAQNLDKDMLLRFKLLVRKEESHGHLPICWGALTGNLGLSKERSQFLYLFLFSRSLLSAAVRLNVIGPYHAQQLLMHSIRPLIILELSRCKNLRTGLLETPISYHNEIEHGPANTWPLGEILAGRHDLQHSKLFNS